MLEQYFRTETAALSRRCLADIKTLDDWTSRRDEYRRQLAEMLGLWPAPARTDLKATIAGKTDCPDFTIEKLQFQSRPGLYVTADLYIPKGLKKPAPAILYACGHAQVKKDGIACGAKAFYQHHGAWFARNGYVCIIPDTLVNGEIEGLHHGLYDHNLWWWLSRGYTPAGVEAWNGIRCIDYLQGRPEVDAQRIGMSGRSGGGAYTWWVSALDERVKVAVPVAGITDMQNHIVDGTIEGHCDCMFMVNTYRWDFAQVAALIAPRPLLISNTDKDTIFPLDGVVRLHSQVRGVYRLYNAADKLGLVITEGPHKDTQDLQVPAFRWFNRHLKQDEGPLKDASAEKLLEPEQLKVFPGRDLPADQINTAIHESFVAPAAAAGIPASPEAWKRQRETWLAELRSKTFGGWPEPAPQLDLTPLSVTTAAGVQLAGYEFTTQEGLRLRFYVTRAAKGTPPRSVVLHVLDQQGWDPWLSAMQPGFAGPLADELRARPATRPAGGIWSGFQDPLPANDVANVWFAPRGAGLSAWSGDVKKQTHILRRFALLGQTLDGMRAWDVRRAVQASRAAIGNDVSLQLRADGQMAAVVLYASLFEPGITNLELRGLPASHRDGPALLNVLKTLDIPATVAMAAERCDVRLLQTDSGKWAYPRAVAAALHWPGPRLVIEQPAGQ
jgi:dienelactone hydrolase